MAARTARAVRNVSETEAILRALEFAQWAGARIHIFHVSLPRGVELANWYRSQGVPATTETCPHYLLLNEDDMPRLHAQGKINPPLRRPADSAGLWEQLADGSHRHGDLRSRALEAGEEEQARHLRQCLGHAWGWRRCCR